MKRRTLLGLTSALAGLPLASLWPKRGFADAAFVGLTTVTEFPLHDPSTPACGMASDRSRTLVFARDNDRDFIDGVDEGLAKAAADRHLDYVVLNAKDDADRMVEQLHDLLDKKIGAVVIAPVDAMRSAPVLKELMRSGTYVGAVVPPPATTILNAPQYLTGKVLADAAAEHIVRNLNGKANVVLLTHDSLQFLSPRFAAMRDVFREMDGVAIVADLSPSTVSEKGGFDTMNTILLAEPQIDIVLGADTVVLGALTALRESGLARPDQFVGGIDGEPAALLELAKPDSPYKTSISLASSIFGYAMGQHAADWLEGKSIPKAIDVLPFVLTVENLGAYKTDMADPGKVYRDPDRLARYLKMYGNTCFDTKDQYVNFPWSSETDL